MYFISNDTILLVFVSLVTVYQFIFKNISLIIHSPKNKLNLKIKLFSHVFRQSITEIVKNNNIEKQIHT